MGLSKEKLKLFQDFSIKLITTIGKNELAWFVAKEVVSQLGFEDCVIYYYDEDNQVLSQVAAIGDKNPNEHHIVNKLSIPLGQGITGQVAKMQKPLMVNDLSREENYIRDIEQGLSELCVPIFSEGKLFGVLDSEARKRNMFNSADLQLFSFIASMMAAKLDLIEKGERLESYALDLEIEVKKRTQDLQKLNAELELLSTTDGLTGLFNRRHLDDQLEKRWNVYARNKESLSLLLIDIDYFKKFNDRYGHQAGDQCLQSVAKIMLNVFQRPDDFIARYGGEEFAIFFSAKQETANVMACKLVKALEEAKILHMDGIGGVVSSSIGGASVVPNDQLRIDEFVQLADQALYESKKNGRAKVTMQSPDHE